MGNTEPTSPDWACTDCFVLLVNGDMPGHMSEEEANEWHARYVKGIGDTEVTPGMLAEFHTDEDLERLDEIIEGAGLMSTTEALDRDITTATDMEYILAWLLTDAMRESPIDVATVETIKEAGRIPAPGLIVTTEAGFTFEIAISRKDPGER